MCESINLSDAVWFTKNSGAWPSLQAIVEVERYFMNLGDGYLYEGEELSVEDLRIHAWQKHFTPNTGAERAWEGDLLGSEPDLAIPF